MLCSLIVYHDRVLLICGIEMLCSLIACYDSMWVICCTAAAPTTGHSMKTWKSSQPLKWAQLRLLTYDFKVLLPTWQAVNVQPGFTESLLSSFFYFLFFKSHGFYLYVLFRSMRPIYYWCMCKVALYVGWFEAICVFWYLLLWFYWTSEEISLRNPEGRCWLFSAQKWNSSAQRGAAMLCTVCSWVCWIVWIYVLSKFSQGRFQSHFCFFYSFTPLH